LIANQQTDFGGRESEFVFRLTDEGYELPRTAYVRGITPVLGAGNVAAAKARGSPKWRQDWVSRSALLQAASLLVPDR